MKFIFSTGSLYSYGLERCFELAARAGFDGVEVMVDYRWDTRQPGYLNRLADQYEQPVLAVHSPFTPSVPGWPDDEPGRIRETVRLAEVVQARIVIHHLPARFDWLWIQAGSRRFRLPLPGLGRHAVYYRWLLESYQELQASTPVLLCIENMPARRWLGRRWNGHRWNSMAEITHFSALTLDTTHLGTWALEPVEVLPHIQEQVRHVHLSNFNGREHRRPEDGQLRLDALLGMLVGAGYEGAISLELEPSALNAGCSDEDMVDTLATSLGYCRDWAAN